MKRSFIKIASLLRGIVRNLLLFLRCLGPAVMEVWRHPLVFLAITGVVCAIATIVSLRLANIWIALAMGYLWFTFCVYYRKRDKKRV